LTGSPGRLGHLKKKNKNDIVLVKKQKSADYNQVFDRVNPPGHIGFFLPLFFLQPGPVPASSRPGPGSIRQARPGFKTMVIMNGNLIDYN
jgi:hypothetical protein